MSEAEYRNRGSTMVSVDPENGWSRDIEEICEAIRANAAAMSKKHTKLYTYYNGQLKYYKIPVIIISGLNSVIAVGLQPYLDQGVISGSNCLLALLCGIIGSIELFLGIQTSMETEMAASKDFYLLSVNIFRTLSLERSHRGHPGKAYLEEVYTQYSKLFETSALIQTKMEDKLAAIPVMKSDGYYSNNSSPISTPVPEKKSGGIRGLFSPRKRKPADEPMKMMDPLSMMEIGTAGMIKPDQIESMGSDLLGGGGFMKDMAPLQGAIHGAVQTAANSYEQMKSIKDTAAAELKNAKKEAAAELENAKKEALDLAASELENAKKEAAAELENAKKEAAAELEKMKKELEAAKASALTSKKVIEEAVSDVKGGTKLSSIPEEQKGKKK
jgi:F0F1-type ATP synthase membrane subunit b/b'